MLAFMAQGEHFPKSHCQLTTEVHNEASSVDQILELYLKCYME